MGHIGNLIGRHTGEYVHSVMIGESIDEDRSNGFWRDTNLQVNLFDMLISPIIVFDSIKLLL